MAILNQSSVWFRRKLIGVFWKIHPIALMKIYLNISSITTTFSGAGSELKAGRQNDHNYILGTHSNINVPVIASRQVHPQCRLKLMLMYQFPKGYTNLGNHNGGIHIGWNAFPRELRCRIPWNLLSNHIMMASSNGNIFRVTGLLCGEFTGHRWIPRTKASDTDLWCFLWSSPEPTIEQTMETPVIWDAIVPIMTSL